MRCKISCSKSLIPSLMVNFRDILNYYRPYWAIAISVLPQAVSLNAEVCQGLAPAHHLSGPVDEAGDTQNASVTE